MVQRWDVKKKSSKFNPSNADAIFHPNYKDTEIFEYHYI